MNAAAPAVSLVVSVGACPVCRRPIRPPFSRVSGPVAHVHHRADAAGCRLIVTPDPDGDDHAIEAVPEGVSLEDALARALARHDRRGA